MQEDKIKKLREQSNQAILNRNVDAVCGIYTDNIIVISAEGSGLTGKETMIRAWNKIFNGEKVLFARKLEEIIVSKSGEMAWESGVWEYSDGGPGGNYSAMWVKVDDKWKTRSELFVSLI